MYTIVSKNNIVCSYENDPDNMCLNKTKPPKPGKFSMISLKFARRKDNVVHTTSESNAYETPFVAPTTKPMNVTKKENVIYHTNLAGPNLGFSFVVDPNFADEFVNKWDEHTSTNFFTGFKVII